MSDFDIYKLMSDSLILDSVSNSFKERVLRQSTEALVQSRRLRKQLRVMGMALMVVMIAMCAFVSGEFWSRHQGIAKETIVIATGGEEQRTSVPRELIAWLDAGRFFDSLGLQERAAQAYKKASEFVDYGIPEFHRVGLNSKEYFACNPKDLKSVYKQAKFSTVEKGSVRRLEKQVNFLAQCY